ncbi:uncharacterized protein LOC108105402 [Drosophila eugracilis]|uniref:uncharacterized protein LOC108105402 n=1 Tax=Drosophila eugracilis TaxID=29029 RepID=UPI0007E7AC79|nr:uncharacterized protein LOC108105402 [Drosophila eugracilis]
MFKILKNLTAQGRCLARGFHTHQKVYQEPGVFVHPELRRTIPFVYFRKGELPAKLEMDILPSRSYRMSPTEKNRRNKEYLRQFCKRQRSCFTRSYIWSEFRRKMIYGSY